MYDGIGSQKLGAMSPCRLQTREARRLSTLLLRLCWQQESVHATWVFQGTRSTASPGEPYDAPPSTHTHKIPFATSFAFPGMLTKNPKRGPLVLLSPLKVYV